MLNANAEHPSPVNTTANSACAVSSPRPSTATNGTANDGQREQLDTRERHHVEPVRPHAGLHEPDPEEERGDERDGVAEAEREVGAGEEEQTEDGDRDRDHDRPARQTPVDDGRDQRREHREQARDEGGVRRGRVLEADVLADVRHERGESQRDAAADEDTSRVRRPGGRPPPSSMQRERKERSTADGEAHQHEAGRGQVVERVLDDREGRPVQDAGDDERQLRVERGDRDAFNQASGS